MRSQRKVVVSQRKVEISQRKVAICQKKSRDRAVGGSAMAKGYTNVIKKWKRSTRIVHREKDLK